MAETHVISGLKAKQDEVRRQITALESQLKAARSDLAALSEALRICGAPRSRKNPQRMFGHGEISRLVLDALREAPEGLGVHELTTIVMKARDFDQNDAELSEAVYFRVRATLYRCLYQGYVSKHSRNGATIWRLNK